MYHIWPSLNVIDVPAWHLKKKWLHRRLIPYLGNLMYTLFYVEVSLQRLMTVMKRCNGQHMSVWFNMTIQLFHFISSIYFNLIFVDYFIFGCFVYFWDVFFISVLLELLDQYLLGGVEPNREDLDHVFLRFGRKRWTKLFIWLQLLFSCFVCNKLIYFFAHFPVFIIIWKSFITKQIFGNDISL